MTEMKQRYKNIGMREDALTLLTTIDGIIESYTAQGLRLSLRQVYYQLVARGIIPNAEKSYKRVGDIVSNGRLAGLLPWDAIEDRNRRAEVPSEFASIERLVEVALRAYRLPRLCGQETYVELWVEKAALEGVLQPVADEFHVVLLANRGYSSQSTMWESAVRIDRRCRDEDTGDVTADAAILYLGDLDPSGEDMVRDVRDRLGMFLDGYSGEWEEDDSRRTSPGGWDIDGCRRVELSVTKLALTMEQVQQYSPPPNPAKVTDSRASKFIEEFGQSSWEVDALPPDVLQAIIRDVLLGILDMEKIQEIKDREETDKQRLREATREIMEE